MSRRVRACVRCVCSVRVLASKAEGGDHVQHAAPDEPIALVRVEWRAGACGKWAVGVRVCVCARRGRGRGVVGASLGGYKAHPSVIC